MKSKCVGLLVLAVLLLEGVISQTQRRSRPKLKLDDFIIATSTRRDRLPLVHATRPLRAGVRTFITVDTQELEAELATSPDAVTHRETYMYYPERIAYEAGSRPWESRWVAMPFLAHHHYGSSYKWMLIGDDDTLWFISGLKRLLTRFDESVPYFISDNIVDFLFEPEDILQRATNLFMSVKPAGRFLRPSWFGNTCLPCHAEKAERKLEDTFKRTVLEGHPWRGCPCTQEQGCLYRLFMCAHQNNPDKELCSMNVCHHSWPWGGTGIVASLGLLQRLTWRGLVQQYVEQHLGIPEYAIHAGDWLLAMLVFEAAVFEKGVPKQGWGITLPPYSALMTGQILSPDYMVFGSYGNVSRSSIMAPAEKLRDGSCDAHCVWLIRHAVSHHASVNEDYGGSITRTVEAMAAIIASRRAAFLHLGDIADSTRHTGISQQQLEG